MSAVMLQVTGMHCQHCRTKVEQALQGVKGVYGAAVDLEAGTAEVDFDGAKVGAEEMVKAVESVGYRARVAD